MDLQIKLRPFCVLRIQRCRCAYSGSGQLSMSMFCLLIQSVTEISPIHSYSER